MAIGDYPIEYDAKVHGPYDPARYYGKPDTPLSQVKLGELTKWLGRRNKHPLAAVGAVSRAWWRWNHKYTMPRNVGVAPYFQILSCCMVIFYVFNYGRIKHHTNYKYH